ncbi:uncharacterized protein LOC109605026 [Aethina tumida]|uniref:uncharacterized protein LOC109605026 n=1 Tax=Aethina tumida TaxID=116153 RepID=UPI002147E7E8|nr:uncharacterized protein LOC109605026 [Aethina tumida]
MSQCSKLYLYEYLPGEVSDFSPNVAPANTHYYIKSDLGPDQQEKIDQLKLETLKENHKYLSEHPEVKAIIYILLERLLKKRPGTNIASFIANYFRKQSLMNLNGDIAKYCRRRNIPLKSGSGLWNEGNN